MSSHGASDGARVGESMREELAESNRKIEELARALQLEQERAAAAEAAIAGRASAAPGRHADKDEKAASAGDGMWSGRVVDARMFMSPHPALTERARFQRLPSVVTWFSEGVGRTILHRAAGAGQRVGVGPTGQGRAVPGEETHKELQVGVEEVRVLSEHESHVWCCALHPLVPLVATGSSDTTVRLWRLDGECLRILRGHKEWVYSIAFDPMGDTLCSAAFDGTLRLWSVSTGECMRIIRRYVPISAHGIAARPDDVHLSMYAHVLNAAHPHRPGVSFHSVAFQPGPGAYLAAASSERLVRIYRVADGEVARTLDGHTNAVTCVVFQPSGKVLATSSVDCTLRLWRAADGSCLRILGERSRAKVWCCAFDRSGLILASGGSDGIVRVWRVADGSVLSAVSGHKGAVRSLCFHPLIPCLLASGEGNLTWGSDNSVRIWMIGDTSSALGDLAQSTSLDMVEGSCKAIVLGHSKMVTCLAFPPGNDSLCESS